MSIKAAAFDIGHTLVRYNNPLNWKLLYKPAFKHVANKCKITFTDEDIDIVHLCYPDTTPVRIPAKTSSLLI